MKTKTKRKKKINRQRNGLHNHPLLKKGGVHQKSNKSKRCLEKVKIQKEWLLQKVFTRIYFEEATQ